MDTTVIGRKTPVSSAEPAWYCLRSQPKHEHIAASQLRILEEVNVFCPRIRFKKATRKGLAWVTEAMFPGYLFAHFNLAELHRQVRYAHGIKGIVQFGGWYPTIEDELLARLKDHTGDADVKEVNYQLSQGDQVKIVGGVFVGLDAVVRQVLPAKERVKVLMDFLGTKVEAEVEHSSVLLQRPHPLAA